MNQSAQVARISNFARLAVSGLVVSALAACQETASIDDARAYHPIPQATLDLMAKDGTTELSPMLIRTFKKEAQFEVWKKAADGQYVYLKTFPMCRWSGQLGPKTREGDRQVPEGFYSIAPGQMNPNSHYYLSFNVGYPNAYDRTHGYTGDDIMVHGICSSAGCFSMTNAQMDEIYALARQAFAGGEREIQLESFPFRMTAENMAKFRLDPNMAFWKQIKPGYDYFEATHHEPKVGVCDRHYVFDKEAANGAPLQPGEPCPALKDVDPAGASLVAAKERKDDAEIAALIAKGAPAVRLVYLDGGQNPQFADRAGNVSRPDALAEGPIEIPVTPKTIRVARLQHGKTITAAQTALMAAEAYEVAQKQKQEEAEKQAEERKQQELAQAARPATSASTATATNGPFYRRWLSLVSAPFSSAPKSDETAASAPTPLQ